MPQVIPSETNCWVCGMRFNLEEEVPKVANKSVQPRAPLCVVSIKQLRSLRLDPHHNVDPPGASFLRPTKKVASMLVQRGAKDVKINLPKDHMSLTLDGLQPDNSIDNTMEDAPIQDEIQREIQLLDLHSRS